MSRPGPGELRGHNRSVSNFPVQEPQITLTDPVKRNLGALQTGDSGIRPKKPDRNISAPKKTGENGNPPEKNFGHPKKSSGVRSCLVKVVDSSGRHRRNRQNHPRKPIESDVLEKEPQFVTMDRVNGGLTKRGCDFLDNKSEKASRTEMKALPR